VSAGLLAALDRPELDALLAEAEHADRIAHTALCVLPLDLGPDRIAQQAGVAQDCCGLWQEALDESSRRWLAQMEAL
jgi:hypothetical protein